MRQPVHPAGRVAFHSNTPDMLTRRALARRLTILAATPDFRHEQLRFFEHRLVFDVRQLFF